MLTQATMEVEALVYLGRWRATGFLHGSWVGLYADRAAHARGGGAQVGDSMEMMSW